MKRNLLIGLLTLIAYSNYAQGKVDSVARVRKPVLLYLLEQDKKARALTIEVKKIPLLEKENKLLIDETIQLKKDTTYLGGLVRTERESAKGWKDTSEKIDSSCQSEIKKQKAFKWVGFGLAVLFGTVAAVK